MPKFQSTTGAYHHLVLMENSLRENCPNTEFLPARIFLYSVLIHENKDQRKIRIWTFFTQWFPNFLARCLCSSFLFNEWINSFHYFRFSLSVHYLNIVSVTEIVRIDKHKHKQKSPSLLRNKENDCSE